MNYFNYFTEIETRFLERRGSILLLSTLDWALIETWREAGIPLEAVLRGIDTAFDKHDAQRLRAPNRRQRKVNGLAWCAQSVLEATEQAREAAVGSAAAAAEPQDSGFDSRRIAAYLTTNAARLNTASPKLPAAAAAAATETAARLTQLSGELGCSISDKSAASSEVPTQATRSLEDLDRTLTILEEKLFAALFAAAPETELTALREQADRELAPYRSKMHAHQIKQIQQQFLQKRLLEAHALPRLSLFYMPHE